MAKIYGLKVSDSNLFDGKSTLFEKTTYYLDKKRRDEDIKAYVNNSRRRVAWDGNGNYALIDEDGIRATILTPFEGFLVED